MLYRSDCRAEGELEDFPEGGNENRKDICLLSFSFAKDETWKNTCQSRQTEQNSHTQTQEVLSPGKVHLSFPPRGSLRFVRSIGRNQVFRRIVFLLFWLFLLRWWWKRYHHQVLSSESWAWSWPPTMRCPAEWFRQTDCTSLTSEPRVRHCTRGDARRGQWRTLGRVYIIWTPW